MADVIMSVYVGKELHTSGKPVNVYDTYAHALAHAATGLATVLTLNPLDGTGAALTQVAKTTGLNVDENGMIHFLCADTLKKVFLIAVGQFGPPRRVQVGADS